MKGCLVIKERTEVAVTNVEMAKVILEIVDDLSGNISNEFDELIMHLVGKDEFKQSEVKAEIKEMIKELQIGELIEDGRLKLTKKGKQWLRKKITELR